MKELKVDYVSDLHLSFYLKAKSYGYDETAMEKFIEEKLAHQMKGDVLVIAGDLSEYVESGFRFLELCSKYYDKVFFVAGNHEYYLSSLFFGKDYVNKFSSNSYNKITKINELSENNDKIVFLDNSNGGIAEHEGFVIAGDTLWYMPKSLADWAFYLCCSNDSRLILSHKSKKTKIERLNLFSSVWYDTLPEKVDLLVTHVPPVYHPNKEHGKNGCYYTDVDTFKADTWIYGHDHVEADFVQDETRFVSNPWGYDSKDFKIKSLTLTKKDAR